MRCRVVQDEEEFRSEYRVDAKIEMSMKRNREEKEKRRKEKGQGAKTGGCRV